MPLDKNMQFQIQQIAEQLSKQVTSSLTLLLNSEVSVSAINVVEAKISSNSLDLSAQKALTTVSFEDASLGSLAIVLELDSAIQLACMMMGSKELSDFDSVKQDALNSALEQAFKEGLKQLQLDSNKFSFKAFKTELVDATNNAALTALQSNKDATGVEIQLNVTGSTFTAYAEISGTLAETLLNTFELPSAGENMSEDEKTVGDYMGTSFAQIVDTHNPEDVDEKKNLNLLLDIRMGLIVELGRAEMHLKDILKLTKGSIIELDRYSGEPVDLFVNNKLIARGEVVVIDDNFGLRITQLAGAQNNREVELGLVD